MVAFGMVDDRPDLAVVMVAIYPMASTDFMDNASHEIRRVTRMKPVRCDIELTKSSGGMPLR